MHVDVSRAYLHAKAQRPTLVKLPAEDCSGKDKGKIGLLKKSMLRYQRRSKQLGTILASASRKLWLRAGAQFKKRVHNKRRKTSGLTHGDDFVVRVTKESLLELKKQLESV